MAPANISNYINVKKAHTLIILLCSNLGTILSHPAGKMKKFFGDRSFSVAVYTMWNVCPMLILFQLLKLILSSKTYLFKLAFSL